MSLWRDSGYGGTRRGLSRRHLQLEKRFVLAERQAGDIPTTEMEEVEGIIHEPRPALAVGRRLGARKAGQPGVVDAADFAVESQRSCGGEP